MQQQFKTWMISWIALSALAISARANAAVFVQNEQTVTAPFDFSGDFAFPPYGNAIFQTAFDIENWLGIDDGEGILIELFGEEGNLLLTFNSLSRPGISDSASLGFSSGENFFTNFFGSKGTVEVTAVNSNGFILTDFFLSLEQVPRNASRKGFP